MERRQIVDLWHRDASTPGGVLITLVRVEGSSYRLPGAHLLIAATGEYAGTISGGCLEAEVLRKAAWKVRNGAVVETYSTAFDDTAEIPYGLGCGGTVNLLLEAANTPECAALLTAMEASLHGQPSEVLTWLPTASARMRRTILSPGEHPGTAEAVQPLYRETLAPPQRLLVFGAGDDARPLVRMAAHLGWRITVADGRAHLARRDRFPEAHRIVTLPDPPVLVGKLELDAMAAVVLMTHSYQQDRDLLATILPTAPRYLGLLGSRHRSSLLLSEAAALTNLSLDQCCDSIYAPIGLDLGGDGPEAIALSILAEIQAVCTGKLGYSRRLTPTKIAEQIAQGGASLYLQTQCAMNE